MNSISPKPSLKYKLAEWKVLIPMSAFLFGGIFLIVNFLGNIIVELVKTTVSDLLHPKPFHIGIEDLYTFQHPLLLYLVLFLIASLCTIQFAYKVRSSFKDLNQNQKDSSRFATLDEVKRQYRAIPEKTERYEGKGGVVISRYDEISLKSILRQAKKVMEAKGMEKWQEIKKLKDSAKAGRLLIDDGAVSNLIIGTTRSGKGETYVFPTIDAYSRAEIQPSLIVNDPKGELLAASKKTMEKRGFHIEVLNLINPLESMSYNLLQLIKEAYKQGDTATAQTLCNTLSFSLYYNPNVKDPFWNNSAMSLCNALILAVIDKCITEKTEDKICMYTVANMLSELGSKEIVIDAKGNTKNALDIYFEMLPADSVAKMQYATSNFAKGETTRGGIFSTAMSKLSIFTFEGIAKMTSRNSIDLKRIGFGKSLQGKGTPRVRVQIIFPDGSKESIKTDTAGRFELDFQQNVKKGQRIHVMESKTKKKMIVEIQTINKDTGETTFKVVEKQDGLQIDSIIIFEKPIAVFMIVPDYDSSNHVIASIFIRQLYFVLSKYAGLARGGKCHREVVYLLDEFGNMPAIDDMGNIVTVCLGRNIRFNLIVQALPQLKMKYGDASTTIQDNCGNQIYIQSGNKETAKEISEKLGNQTINSLSRSGKGLSIDKSKTEGIDTKPLLTPTELMRFQEGESAVIRFMKRRDNKFEKIEPFPILNRGKTVMKYRWEYLGDDFDTDQSILDIDIRSLHEYVNPRDLIIDFFPKQEEEPTGQSEEPKQITPGSEPEPVPTPSEEEHEEPQFADIDEEIEISEEAYSSEPVVIVESSSVFEPLTLENWEQKTAEEFFETHRSIWSVIEKKCMKQWNRPLADIQASTMESFIDDLKILVTTGQIDKNTYRLINGKYGEIMDSLLEKEGVKEEV
ncbi:VirD4-like conjugal transfer protein, CD1115 family [Bacillus pseudomycoides]|uniref:VirD4-like conjugal transfer protein, CD1115 family n=1 Tax=Bacillus pseudomycoides TaxID=64104 RepID=UPI00211E3B23|nr:type IV secretory system conjugative DNA transfer family protein [Bacillus pseudomycoides]